MFGRQKRRVYPYRHPATATSRRPQPRTWQRLFEQLEDRAMLSSVQLDMRADPQAHTWEVFAVVSPSDNAGLAGVAFNVVGSSGLTVNAATFQPPVNFATQSQNQPTVGQNMAGLQDRNTAATGVGQTTAVRLASGTYTGFAGTLTVEALDDGASVLPTGWQPNMNINPELADSFFGDAQNIPAVIGDANRNSLVDAADFVSVQVHFSTTGAAGIPGDADLNGIVNAADMAAVLEHLGATAAGTPVAVNDAFTTNEDITITRTAPALLTNDTDPNGDALTAEVVATPASGTLTLNPDGSFVYIPNLNFHGADSFTYRVSDGTNTSNTATVTITINPVNDVAQAANDMFTMDEDGTLPIPAPGVLTNDTDIDGDPLTAVVPSDPAHGTLTLNANGSFVYEPDANFNGTDSFTYRANDGTANSELATVTITISAVNDPPQAANDSFNTPVDTTLTITAPGVLSNDSDIDNASGLSVVLVDDADHGDLTFNANGSFTYIPDTGFTGPDSFTYRANDGTTDSGVATVTIVVGGDAPEAAADSFSIDEDQTLTVPAPGVLENDDDPNAEPLTAVFVAGPSHGSLTLNPDGSFTYTPIADFNGTDSFTYRSNDGVFDSPIATVTITVNPVNDAPIAVGNLFAIDEDQPLVVSMPGLLVDDTDVDDDDLTAELASDVAHGTLTFHADGSFTYTPDLNFHGTDSFAYRVNDGALDSAPATVTLTINAVSEAPTAAADSFIIDEDSPLTVASPGVLLNDSDDDGAPLTAVRVNGPGYGTLTLNPDGSFTYAPHSDFNGEDSFTYLANDGAADSPSATVTITVNAVNDLPAAENDSYSTGEDQELTIPAPGVLDNDDDPDGIPLTAVPVSPPAHGFLVLNADGSLTYMPNLNFNGDDSFQYQADDGTATSNVATVTITVNAVNDLPAVTDDAYSIVEGTPLVVAAPGVLDNDNDADGDPLTAVEGSGPSHGTLIFNDDGSFTYTPEVGFVGTDSFTYLANDGTANSAEATVVISVTAANIAPEALGDAYDTDEDTPLTIAAPGVLDNDNDDDGDPLTAVLASGPSNGTLMLNADGSFTYTPDADFNGTDSFTYRANDGAADSELAMVVITVNAVNDPPEAANYVFSTDEDEDLVIDAPGLLLNSTDVDGDFITVVPVPVTDPSHGILTLNADGSFTYAPNQDFNGTDSFTYRVNDETVDSDIATVTITVNAVNDPPVATDDNFDTDEDVPLVVAAPGLLLTTSDVDGDDLTVAVVTTPANGTLTFDPDGSFIYTPNADFNGTDSFDYQVSDGTVTSNVATVFLTVNSVNDPPQNNVPGPLSTPADTPLVFIGGNAITISDVDSAAGFFTVTLTATNGLLTVSGASGLFFTEGDGTDDAVMTFTGTLEDINVAMDGMSFTPTTTFIGMASVQIVTEDEQFDTDDDTIEITVTTT